MQDELGAYSTRDQKPRIKPSVCAYLDILGFTAAMREAERHGTSNDFLGRFAHVVDNWFATLGDMFAREATEVRRREFKVFTDNVIVGAPIETGGLPTELSFVLSDIGRLQVGLVFDGFFVRGAASVGELYMDESVVYGGAILDAYELEKAAVAPRVVLHASAKAVVAREIKNYHATYHERRGHRFTDQVLVDSDGQWFINYLHGRFTGGSLFESDYGALEQHRDMISSRLRAFALDPRVLTKYQWAASYHNYFCQRYAPDGPRFPGVAPLMATHIEATTGGGA